GWRVSDAVENNPDGVDQSFASREAPIDPPEMTLPRLILRYDATGIEAPDPPVMDTGATPTTDLECGDVIKQDTILGKDLVDCPGEGLVIGAPGIVLDLNGHWIDGPDYLINNISGQEEGFPAGIRNGGHSNVLITNSKGTECSTVVREKPGCEGGVREFGYGVLLAGTTFNVVENLHMHTNAMAGVELQDADDGRNGNTIRNNFIHDNELGITLLNDSYGSLVEGNKIHGNLGEAILIELSDGHTIKNNEIVGVPFNPNLDSDGGFLLWTASNNTIIGNVLRDTGDAGLVLAQGSDNNRIGGPPAPGGGVGSGEGNRMWNNGDAGVYIQDSENNQVINNVAHQESDGGVVINGANGTVIKDNDLRFNPNGIETADSNDILVQGNDASQSQQDGFAIGNGINVVIRDNVANRTGGVGIGFEGAAFDANGLPVGTAVIAGNTANQNLAEGIEIVDGGGHLVADNTAFNNLSHGIVAEGNVDGGGNVASGNGATPPSEGNPGEPPPPGFLQCIGVVCADPAAPPYSAADTAAPNAWITDGPVGAPPSSPWTSTTSLGRTASTTASFDFTALDPPNADGSDGFPLTALVFSCRLDPPPDIIEPVEPVDPDPGPPEPGPPDVNDQDPYLGEGWGECIPPVHYHNLEAGIHRFEVMVQDQNVPDANVDLTPEVYYWEVDLTAEDAVGGPDTKAPDTVLMRSPDAETIATA
ncbi:MAG TPA: right-handed parallel beta-helix repeat-containing protein, partial [Actinomycetota bacterium]|nr:right-handed parallel beta-helix repeat-containing protein [Actinomycetota bacterium]